MLKAPRRPHFAAAGAFAAAAIALVSSAQPAGQQLPEPSSFPSSFFALETAVVFSADDGVHGFEPWVSDGSFRGTRLLADVGPEPARGSSFGHLDSPFALLGAPGGRPLLALRRDCRSWELWTTDGTRGGTVRLLPQGLYLRGHASISGSCRVLEGGVAYAPARGLLYFFAFEPPGRSTALWVSDGSAEGTRKLRELPGRSVSLDAMVATAGGRAFFLRGAFVDSLPMELWTSDGTAAGTRRVAAVTRAFNAESDWIAQRPLTPAGEGVIFYGADPERGVEPWVSDGTVRGTGPVADIEPGPADSGVLESFFATAGQAFFVAKEPDGFELWVSDGTPRGTRRLTAFAVAEPFKASLVFPELFFGRAGALTLFPADDGEHGEELWVSDGTPRGTRLLADICPGPCSSAPRQAATLGDGRALWTADDGVHGSEPWVTDGTPAGTRLLADLCPGPCGSGTPLGPHALVGALGRTLLVAAGRGELWAVRPGEEPQRLFAGEEVGWSGGALGSRLLFAADDGLRGVELWITDGTPSGTRLLRDIASSSLRPTDPWPPPPTR